MNLQPQILALLEASLLRPLVLVAAALLILRFLRVRHPASRHAVWTAVLIGMLALPFISVVTPDWTLRVLPWSQDVAKDSQASPTPAVVVENDPVDAASLSGLPQAETSSAPPASFVLPSIETLIVWGYLAGLFAMLTYRLMGWVLLTHVVFRSKALRPACLRESADVVTPVAVGVLFPSVILPAGWRNWNARTKRAVLAHEFAHLHRRDTVIAALARLVKSVFWFHPVAWWVSRQTSDMAELACDAVALQRVADPAGYSRVLVEFASAVTRTRPRVALPGLAIASSSRMGERIDQVFELCEGQMRRLPRPGMSLIAMGLPALTLAATVVLSASAPVQHSGASAGQVGLDPTRHSGASAGQVRSAGQTAVSKPRYEAATIKPCPPEETPQNGGARGTAGGTNATASPGRFTVPCVTTEQLIYLAYASYGVGPEEHLQNDDAGTASSAQKIRGGPDWVHSSRDKYMIEAIAPGVTERTTLMGSMLQTLLEERFQLKQHRESEEVPMFALTVAKTGFKLKPMKDGDCDPDDGPPSDAPGAKPKCGNLMMTNGGGVSRWTFSGSPISSLASMLSRSLGVHVIDRTNITDRFMFQFKFFRSDGTSVIRDAAGRDVTDTVLGGPSVDEALSDQLGLKLDRIKAPREHIVIDHIQRPTPDDRVQAPAGVTPTVRFDVVSIKPCLAEAPPPTGQGGRAAGPGGAISSPGRVHWACVTLGELIGTAYGGPDNRLLHSRTQQRPGDPKPIRGGPAWVDSEKFAVEASGAGNVDRATLIGPMLRALLEDRFQLKTHRESEERSMYALTIAKSGLKAKRTSPTDCNDDADKERAQLAFDTGGLRPCGLLNMAWNGGNRQLTLAGVTLQHVAEGFLSDLVMDRSVIDQTSLAGKFNVEFEFAPDDSTPGGAAALRWARRADAERPTAPSIFKALEEQLGLKLVATKARAEYLVIDSVQRPRPN
jgi:uncharacterized protein (TIGR03435 family)